MYASAFVPLQMRARRETVSEADLNLERVAAVDSGRPRGDRREARVELFAQPFGKQLFADGRNAIGSRSRDRNGLNRPVERLRLPMRDPLRIRAFSQVASRAADDRAGRFPAHPGKLVFEKLEQRMALCIAEHLNELPEFNAARMWFDVYRAARKLDARCARGPTSRHAGQESEP